MTEPGTKPEAPAHFVLQSESDGTRVPVNITMTVGRDSKCDLVVPSVKASRVHAKLWLEGNDLWVQDEGSTNGTFVNEQKVSEKTRLNANDNVRFANIRYAVIDPAAENTEETGSAMEDAGATMLHTPGETALADEPPAATPPAPPAEAPATAKKESPSKAGESTIDPHESTPSIPVSWADADALEQASHTKLVSRAPAAGAPGRDSTDPLRAIALARREAPPEDPILVGLTDPIRGNVIKLRRKKEVDIWEIGRGENADIHIDSKSVSGRHAQLVWERDRWKVVNLMSVNGTFVNDRKVLSAYLNSRDRIRVGDVELAFDGAVERRRKPRKSKPRDTGTQSEGFLQGIWSKLKRLFGKS